MSRKSHKYYTSTIVDSGVLTSSRLQDAIKRACTSKTVYATKEQAEKAALYLRSYLNIKNIYPYRCRFCDNWHNGHRYD